jgi:Holliday junction resolvase RusA-like endonuclease
MIAEARVRAAWDAAGRPRIPDDTPISALVACYLRRPPTHYKRNGELSATGQRAGSYPRKKPDVDNVAKLVLDALEGYAYASDASIVILHIVKEWCDEGSPERVFINLETLDET